MTLTKTIPFSFLIFLIMLSSCTKVKEEPAKQWYKGNLHTHSLWSDGDDYPEMIMDWYKTNGYHFVGLSDHNVFQEGEKWVKVPQAPVRRDAFQEYLGRFGEDWVEYEQIEDTLRVKLKTLAAYDTMFNEPERFLIIKSEEITDQYENKPVHLNATNLVNLVEPQGGGSIVNVMQNNIDAVLAQREATGQPMFPHLNHPNFGWAITAEDMMQLTGERFFEVYNGHPAVNNYGDSTRMGTEEMWDRINLHYIQNGQPLLYGLATDDSHNYHLTGPLYSNTGRGWVMVHASELNADTLINAMEAGDFYATTGVTLSSVEQTDKSIEVKVEPEAGVQYTIQFIGVPQNSNDPSILSEVKDTVASYQITNEIFVRAKVISDKRQINPFQNGDMETAWTQPVLNGDLRMEK